MKSIAPCATGSKWPETATQEGARPSPNRPEKLKNYKYGTDSRSIYRATAYGIDGTGMAPWDGILEPEDMWAILTLGVNWGCAEHSCDFEGRVE